jgi:hypothetical protein
VITLRLRITKVDERQFLLCLKHSVWGSRSARFKDWHKGDFLVVMVNKALAGLGTVSGTPFYSEAPVWDNGPIYPYRIPIKFLHILKQDQRPLVLGEVREILTSVWGPTYGWGIMNQSVIEGPQAEALINTITQRPNALSEIEQQLPILLEENSGAILNPKTAVPVATDAQVEKVMQNDPLNQENEEHQESESLHSATESALIKLGKVTGCSVCIASNDRNRQYQGRPLGEDCLRSFPNFGLNEEATRTIKLIDVIWTIRNSPVCAFEVETTTSIYSGLLRMSDLLSVVPSLNIKLYIIAPKEREAKVRFEINRPTFQKIGLNEYCKFIPIEELNKLLPRVEGLQGHIQPSIIDTIAIAFEEETLDNQ